MLCFLRWVRSSLGEVDVAVAGFSADHYLAEAVEFLIGISLEFFSSLDLLDRPTGALGSYLLTSSLLKVVLVTSDPLSMGPEP